MIRYFGFLANRVVGKQLPRVKKALGQGQDEEVKVPLISHSSLSQGLLKTDPYSCLLCGARMVFNRALAATRLAVLVSNAGEIARMRYVG
ncbi:hypothetical protein [Serratia proteamaculans]|uniref:Transposase n=1 Tax=Serratia proteamaculans TaxID=28151 RepID=A0A5Q2VBA0_SERPR|nr:hypothetical protein [Serratia proteamaculans]QGH61369.1 hypothetical protein GHV41_11205 [Serratia proteamaculans]